MGYGRGSEPLSTLSTSPSRPSHTRGRQGHSTSATLHKRAKTEALPPAHSGGTRRLCLPVRERGKTEPPPARGPWFHPCRCPQDTAQSQNRTPSTAQGELADRALEGPSPAPQQGHQLWVIPDGSALQRNTGAWESSPSPTQGTAGSRTRRARAEALRSAQAGPPTHGVPWSPSLSLGPLIPICNGGSAVPPRQAPALPPALARSWSLCPPSGTQTRPLDACAGEPPPRRKGHWPCAARPPSNLGQGWCGCDQELPPGHAFAPHPPPPPPSQTGLRSGPRRRTK